MLLAAVTLEKKSLGETVGNTQLPSIDATFLRHAEILHFWLELWRSVTFSAPVVRSRSANTILFS